MVKPFHLSDKLKTLKKQGVKSPLNPCFRLSRHLGTPDKVTKNVAESPVFSPKCHLALDTVPLRHLLPSFTGEPMSNFAKSLRATYNESQVNMAHFVGVSVRTWKRWEAGAPISDRKLAAVMAKFTDRYAPKPEPQAEFGATLSTPTTTGPKKLKIFKPELPPDWKERAARLPPMAPLQPIRGVLVSTKDMDSKSEPWVPADFKAPTQSEVDANAALTETLEKRQANLLNLLTSPIP